MLFAVADARGAAADGEAFRGVIERLGEPRVRLGDGTMGDWCLGTRPVRDQEVRTAHRGTRGAAWAGDRKTCSSAYPRRRATSRCSEQTSAGFSSRAAKAEAIARSTWPPRATGAFSPARALRPSAPSSAPASMRTSWPDTQPRPPCLRREAVSPSGPSSAPSGDCRCTRPGTPGSTGFFAGASRFARSSAPRTPGMQGSSRPSSGRRSTAPCAVPWRATTWWE